MTWNEDWIKGVLENCLNIPFISNIRKIDIPPSQSR